MTEIFNTKYFKQILDPQVLTSLRMLLLMKKSVLQRVCRQVAYGLHELLRTNAANIHSSQDWCTLFMLLECVGAGAAPPSVHMRDAKRENDIQHHDTGIKLLFGLNKEKFTRARFEPATSGLTCRSSVN